MTYEQHYEHRFYDPCSYPHQICPATLYLFSSTQNLWMIFSLQPSCYILQNNCVIKIFYRHKLRDATLFPTSTVCASSCCYFSLLRIIKSDVAATFANIIFILILEKILQKCETNKLVDKTVIYTGLYLFSFYIHEGKYTNEYRN